MKNPYKRVVNDDLKLYGFAAVYNGHVLDPKKLIIIKRSTTDLNDKAARVFDPAPTPGDDAVA